VLDAVEQGHDERRLGRDAPQCVVERRRLDREHADVDRLAQDGGHRRHHLDLAEAHAAQHEAVAVEHARRLLARDHGHRRAPGPRERGGEEPADTARADDGDRADHRPTSTVLRRRV
jgi:hypothetical protein